MAYNTKKYLDEEGLKQVVRLLDEYPDNQILGTVIDEIQGELDKKADIESIPEVPVQDVQIGDTSILNNNIAKIPGATANNAGIVKINASKGISTTYNANDIFPTLALRVALPTEIKNSNGDFYPITASMQHNSVFYGFAKAAGDTTQSQSSNAVGTYTDEAKTAIKQMLGVQEGLKVVRLI